MWQELEKFVRLHAGTSARHQQILECLLECKKSEDTVMKSEQKMEESSSAGSTAGTEEKKPGDSQLDQAWKEYDR